MKKACFESNDGCSKNYWFSISISIYWWYWSWYRYWFWVLKNIDIGLDIGFKKILILMFISILIFLSKKYWYRYWYWKRKFEKYWYWYCLKIWYCPGSAPHNQIPLNWMLSTGSLPPSKDKLEGMDVSLIFCHFP